MRRWIIVAGLALTACGGGALAPAPTERAQLSGVQDFDAIALDSDDSVEVRRGDDYAVHIEGPAGLRERLAIRRDGNVLRIRRRRQGLWAVDQKAARIQVTMPAIHAATLSGSGDITIDQAGDPFAATLGGSGDMTIGQLQGDRTSLTISGSGTIAAAGSVRTLALTTTGSGDIDARQVQAAEAVLSIGGTGSATLGPGARCTIRRVGTGEAHCG